MEVQNQQTSWFGGSQETIQPEEAESAQKKAKTSHILDYDPQYSNHSHLPEEWIFFSSTGWRNIVLA